MIRLGLSSIQKRFISTQIVDSENMLYSIPVKFVNGYKEQISVNAVYQDTDPANKSRAIVFAQHGAPGSHKDFKYITPQLQKRGIRMVCINYPGIGVTESPGRLTSTNDERNNYAQAIINKLELTKNKNVIFLGHSRGGENALELTADNVDEAIGAVMLNSVGLWRHRGARFVGIYKSLIFLTKIKFPFIFKFLEIVYNRIGLRVPNGRVAANALAQILTFDFDKQLPYIKKISNHKKVKVMYAFSGQDFLIEPEHSLDYVKSFETMKVINCPTLGDKEDNQRVIDEATNFYNSGERLLATYFEKEDHFLQKNRADFVVEVIESMVENRYHTVPSNL